MCIVTAALASVSETAGGGNNGRPHPKQAPLNGSGVHTPMQTYSGVSDMKKSFHWLWYDDKKQALTQHGLLSLVSMVGVWYSSVLLPAQVAIHFNISGQANGFISHQSYIVLVSSLLIGFPCLIFLMFQWSAHHPETLQIPQREYWLRSENRARMEDYLAYAGQQLSIKLTYIMIIFHGLILTAHRNQPIAITKPLLYGSLALIGILWWCWQRAFWQNFSVIKEVI